MHMTLDPRPDESVDGFLDTALPTALLVAVASWLPAAVLLLGYAVRVVRAALRGDDSLPPLTDIRGLGVTGLRAAAVVLAFHLPALGCLGLTFVLWSVVDHGRFYGDAVGLAFADPVALLTLTVASPDSSLLVVAGLVLTGVVAVAGGYLGTAGFVTFAATDRLALAFDSDTLLATGRSKRFSRGVLLALTVSFVGSGVAWAVALVPLVGPFAGAFVELFVLVGALRLVADGYDPAVSDAVVAGERSDSAAATEPRPNSAT